MPHYTVSLELACAAADLFAFLARPRNLVQLAPPDLHLELLAGPEVLERGSRLYLERPTLGRFAAYRPGSRGIRARHAHRHRAEARAMRPLDPRPSVRAATDNGVRLDEQIDFDPPSGLLGRLIGADFIRKDLDKLYAYRQAKLREIFKKSRAPEVALC